MAQKTARTRIVRRWRRNMEVTDDTRYVDMLTTLSEGSVRRNFDPYTDIDWKSPDIAIPAFLTLAIMPFAYSITAGIGVGFIAHVVIKTATGKVRSVHPLMWVASAMFVVYFTLVPLQNLLGL